MSVAEQAVSPVEQRRTPASHPPDEEDQVRVKRRTLQEVLEQCQRALELLKNSDQDPNAALEFDGVEDGESSSAAEASADEEPCARDLEADELCELIKSKVDSPTFLEKLGSCDKPVSHNISDNTASLDLVMDTGSWENVHVDVEKESDPDDYVLVSQEDIVEGISCFMAAYLLSLNQAKELTPTQLQEALSKTFSVKKRKSKLRKAWDGSKVIYNVASWGATAIGLYQNPAVFRVASVVFWSSCRVISKLL